MSASFDSPGAMTHSVRAEREPVVIALVNNMGDGALEATEKQFRELLGAAGQDFDVRLRMFSFPELIRGEAGRAYVIEHYERIEALWTGEFDGLIVTGAEPRTAALPDELYWPSLTRLVDWAQETTTPVVWSCLAAHATVLYLDGIRRRRLGTKISGLFPCAKVSDHSLVAGLPATWRIPHSRLNTLDPELLVRAGYEIVSLSDEAGVDAFIVRRRALFVFYQGHPEYDAGALFREYRRDVGRFLAGTMDRYPEMPRGYFDEETARSFNAFRTAAERQRRRELLDEFPDQAVRERLAHAWHDVAVQLYRNWLTAIVAERGAKPLVAAAGAGSAESP